MAQPSNEPFPEEFAELIKALQDRPVRESLAHSLARLRREYGRLTHELLRLLPEQSASKSAEQLRLELINLHLLIAEFEHQIGNQN